MKVLLAFVLAVGSVSSLGSGPYLPSGWRPKGPAFLLPTQVQTSQVEEKGNTKETPSSPPTVQPSDSQDVIQESEASGSDFLREYGPPLEKDSFKAFTEQALPNVETERPFFVIETVAHKSLADESGATKQVSDETAAIEARTVDESNTSIPESGNEDKDYDQTTAADPKSIQEISTTNTLPLEDSTEVTTAKVEILPGEDTTQSIPEITTDDDSNLIVKTDKSPVNNGGSLEYLPPILNEVDDKSDEVLLLKGKSIEGLKDDATKEYLPPALNDAEEKVEDATPLYQAKLETESQVNIGGNLPVTHDKDDAESSQDNNKSVSDVKTNISDISKDITVNANDEKTEESSGLEPKEREELGFREYGPPKNEVVLEKSEAEKIKNNEARRRRFSTKFAPQKQN